MSATSVSASSLAYPECWGDVLRRAYGSRHTAKLAARDLARSERTCQAWLQDRFSPTYRECTAMVRQSGRLRMAVLQLMLEGLPDAPSESRHSDRVRAACCDLADALHDLMAAAQER